MVAEETPRGPQTAHRMGQLIVFDQCDFQKTFFGTFLISSFVWNKTRAVDLSRNDLGLKNVIFEPGGNFFNHRDKITMIEKNSTVAIFDFGYLLSSEDNVLHVSAQQEFHYETNWRMLPTLSWIQQTRQRGKWPPDHQVIANLAKHVGLDNFQETFISYSVGRLQTYSWIPGAYVNILIILGEYSARARISWGHKKLEAEQHALILNNIKIWKPPFIQQLQCHCGEYKTMIGDEEVTGEIGEVRLKPPRPRSLWTDRGQIKGRIKVGLRPGKGRVAWSVFKADLDKEKAGFQGRINLITSGFQRRMIIFINSDFQGRIGLILSGFQGQINIDAKVDFKYGFSRSIDF
ncbi:hypothetical protein Bca101_019692 [Brassica carinata]